MGHGSECARSTPDRARVRSFLPPLCRIALKHTRYVHTHAAPRRHHGSRSDQPPGQYDRVVLGRADQRPFGRRRGDASLPGALLQMPWAAEAREFTGDIDDFGPLDKDQKRSIRKGIKVMCREIQMGVAAAQRALADAGLTAG